MSNSLFHSILTTLEEHIDQTRDYPSIHPPNQLLFDPQASYYPSPINRPNIASRLSSLGLPEVVLRELDTLVAKDIQDGRNHLEQVQQRLLEQLCTVSMAPDPSLVPSLIRTAFDAFYTRSMSAKMDALQQEVSTFSLQQDSASDCGESSESDQGMFVSRAILFLRSLIE